MSTDAAEGVARGGGDAEARLYRAILRLAFGVAGSFVLAEALNWDFTFLAPMLCAQLLVKSNAPPSIREAVATLVIVALAMIASLALTAATISSLPVLILAFLLILFLTFYGQARGLPDFIALMLQLGAVTILVLGLVAPSLANEFAVSLFKAMAEGEANATVELTPNMAGPAFDVLEAYLKDKTEPPKWIQTESKLYTAADDPMAVYEAKKDLGY